MRIQHNIMAMNAYRNYNNNTSALSGNLEKLSSGYKINRAGDDAAGLAISEKMRAQISGLEQASSNVKDGISLVKTGEGAMQEIQDMLNRMVTLATQSANGTYDEDVDRANLQKEVTALQDEINRIADSANFNGIKLLDGSLESGSDQTVTGSMIDMLPKVGETPGTNTVLHVDESAATAGSEFYIDLGNVSWSASSNDVLTLKLGTQAFTFKATQTTTYGATAIATAIVASMTGATTQYTAGANKFTWTTSANATTPDKITAAVSNTNQIHVKQGTVPTTSTEVLAAPTTISLTVGGGSLGVKNASGADYNPAVINVTNVTLDDAARLGSTTFKLTSNMVSAGSSITLGNHTISFTDDSSAKSTPVKTDVVYVGDLNLSTEEGMTEVAARITRANAKDSNATFSVGYNGSQITLLENQKTPYYVGTTASNPDFDLSTLDGWEKALTYSSAPSVGGSLTLQIGDTADDFNKLNVSITDMHTQSLGINGIDISTQEGASTAIDKIKAAINKVSSTRGDLGAIQNRLEHTGNNLSVMTENIQDAESTIRDTDIAEEMMSYTKNNILVQSAQAMLAQANTVPQGVLQLLQ